ncbi:MAG TPA: MFS transporter [Rhizomicrobium sp.]|jgi:MFS family permease|nr:MFS transporter [Rhizomicrobium sp.]
MTDIYEGLTDEHAREAAYEGFVWRNLRRNFAGHFVHGMLGMTGFRLVNTPTFIPAYLHQISGGSDFFVSLGASLQQLGGVISPIAGAAQIEHRKKIMPVSMFLGTMMRVQILGIALAGWFLGGTTLLVSVLVFLFLLGLFSGPQGVAFQFLLAKMIPIARRGQLQGWRNFTGGFVAAGLAWVAGKYLIGHNVFGNGYSTTFTLAFILTSLGLTAFRFLVREPEPPTIRAKSSFGERVRDLLPMLRGNPDFMWFMIARTFAITNRVAQPFYILYAGKKLGFSGDLVGLTSFAFLGADTVMSLAWGYLADRYGFRSNFIIALVLWIASTILLMQVSSWTWLFIAFFGIGAGNSGYQMSAQNIVFEFGHRDDMAMRLAFSNTAEGIMSTAGPLLGGVIAASFGYFTVFWVAVACEAIALVLLVTLVEEPRKKRLQLEAEKAAALSATSTTSLADREDEEGNL